MNRIPTNEQTVLLAIPHYVFTSDLLRTDYIKELASKYRVLVLTPMLDDKIAKERGYFASPNVVYLKYGSSYPKFWHVMKFLRLTLVNEFDYLTSMRHYYQRPIFKNDWRRRLVRYLAKPFAALLTAGFFTKIENIFLPKAPIFELLIDRCQPSLVVTSTPGFDSWEAEIILYSKRRGIPTVANNFTWDNLTMNCKHMRKTDWLVAWNSIMKKEAIDIHGFRPEQVFVAGTPRFDPYFTRDGHKPTREEFLKSKGLNPKYKTIFHTTVTRAYPFQKKYIRDLIELRSQGRIPYVNLFIRIHPLDNPETYTEFSSSKDFHVETAGRAFSERGKTLVEMSYADLLNLRYSLEYTDLNINYASTISIEACIFDKPVINIGYFDRFALAYEFNHYRPIYESGAVRLAKTDEDLPELINMYLKNPALDQDRRTQIVKDYVTFTDGLAYKRNVDFLEEIDTMEKQRHG